MFESLPSSIGEAEMNIIHPATGENLLNSLGDPMTVTVVGLDSKEYKASVNSFQKKLAGKKSAKFRDWRDISLDEARDAGLSHCIACVKGWNGLLDSTPQDSENTPHNN